MAFQISRCLIPLIQKNKHQILQYFNRYQRIKNFSSDCENSKQTASSCKTKSNDPCKKKNENVSAVLCSPKDIRIEARPMPKITSSQVLVKIMACGICHQDLTLYNEGQIRSNILKHPIVIGHEASGEVMEVGCCITNLKVGDKVTVEPQIPCRLCQLCKKGKYQLCPHLKFCGTPPFDGNTCRYFAHDADFCHKIPCHLDHEVGALISPLAIGVHACKRCEITCGDALLILGCGTVGLLTMQAARAYGASPVVILDTDSFKLKRAMDLGADCAINVKDVPEQEIVKKITEIIGRPPNKTIDCTGHEKTIRVGMLSTGKGGKMGLVGSGKHDQCLPIMETLIKEIKIVGSLAYANDFGTSIGLVADGKVDVKSVITHHFKLEDACEAYAFANKQECGTIKVLIHADPEWKPTLDKCKKGC
ncbi:sorbitol dehydrogenase-like [Anthonomus grandis grandis]|uniref:sorbitol dehydrogenase-like n=1 Tax=Anthonomus grandis grandis TaxID=2921223 RepID=UPI00216611B7|nr:sorbitol dehydrogenase-like [Anthonomus grandis grandis]